MPFAIIMFCMFFGMAVAWAALWTLKKLGAAHRKKIHPPAGFLAGALIFTSVYGLNRLAFPAWPKAVPVIDLVLLAGILVIPEVKRKLGRPGPKSKPKLKPKLRTQPKPVDLETQRLRIEAKALERMLEIDPLNAFCFERLSEIYEKTGEYARALEAAREAAKLDPTVKNRLRAEELEKETQPQRKQAGE
jgi:tetratricopeptide (TPR) repeat protein